MKDTKIMICVCKNLFTDNVGEVHSLIFSLIFVHMNPEDKVSSPYKQTKSTGYWRTSGFIEITGFLKAK